MSMSWQSIESYYIAVEHSWRTYCPRVGLVGLAARFARRTHDAGDGGKAERANGGRIQIEKFGVIEPN